jgi:vacuolar protein-sorting-associated protein 4
VLVLGATNCPWELDSAIRRRFEKRIYIPLPDPVARKVQFQIRLGKTPHSCTEESFTLLADNSEGYSGSDITVVVKEAMMMPVRRCRTATRFKNLPDG